MSTSDTAVRRWFKSSFSRSTSNCVEVSHDADAVLIRDSKYDGDPINQPIIGVAAQFWAVFLENATAGVNTSATESLPAIHRDPDTGNTSVQTAAGTRLIYTSQEWAAFLAGIRAGEFTLQPATVP